MKYSKNKEQVMREFISKINPIFEIKDSFIKTIDQKIIEKHPVSYNFLNKVNRQINQIIDEMFIELKAIYNQQD